MSGMRSGLAAVFAQHVGSIRRLRPADLFDLCLPLRHPPAVERARHDLIAGRVRLIAALFSALTLAWIPIDLVTIPEHDLGAIILGRATASAAFLAMALRPRSFPGRAAAAIEVGLLVAVPLGFFLYTTWILSGHQDHETLAESMAYFYLPFIVAAGLAIFPLTALEAVLPAGLTLAAMALAVLLWPQFLGGQSEVATLWRLFLIASIAVLAGMSQLRFLLRVTEQATRDGLTALLVRSTGEEILESQFAYAQRHDLPYAVLFIDVDHFKSVNDEFGHDAGDAGLRTVATQIARAFRHQDVLIRWGGEEFVVGLPGANLANAEVAVLRLAKLGLGLRPDYRPITASIGIAERQADGIETLGALVEHADSRMYEAKKSGRNRYVFRGGPKIWLAPQQNTQSAAE